MTQTVKDAQGNVIGTFPDGVSPDQIKKALADRARTPEGPTAPPAPAPTWFEGALQSLTAPWRDDPADVNKPTLGLQARDPNEPWYTRVFESDMPEDFEIPQETTEDVSMMGLPERVTKLMRTAALKTPGMVASVPRALGELFSSIERVPGGEPSQYGLRYNPPTEEKLPEAVKVLPTERDVTEGLYYRAGFDFPETAPVNPSGRVLQAATSGVTGGAVGGLPGVVAGGLSATAGQTARELGAPEPLAMGLEILGGMKGASGIAKTGTAARNLVSLGVPEQVIAEAARTMRPHEIDAAVQLMRDAQTLGGPRNQLTFAEAANQVTGGRVKSLTDLQRFVEPNAPELQGAMADRAAVAHDVAGQQAEAVAGGALPQGEARVALPGQVQDAAQGAIRRMEQGVTDASTPNYQRALNVPVDEALGANLPAWQEVLQRPAIQDAFRTALTNRANRGRPPHQWITIDDNTGQVTIQAVPTPADIDSLMKQLQAGIDSLETPTGKVVDPTGLIPARDALQALATESLPDYATARFAHGQMAEGLNPTKASPLGTIMKAEGDAQAKTAAQKEALLPSKPTSTDPATLRMTVRQLRGGTGPRALTPAVRQQLGVILDSEWDEIAQGLKGDPNAQGGAAKFRAQLAGNRAQAGNLQAVIEEAAGADVWQGFNRMLDVFEAQGFRQAPGSQTTFNQLWRDRLSQSRLPVAPEEAGLALATGGRSLATKAGQSITERFQQARLRGRAQSIGDMLLDPDAAATWRRLAQMDPSSPNAARLVQQLLGTGAGMAATDREKE